MRRLLIRSVLSVLALALLAVAWIVAGPCWARALDAIHTTRLATVTSLSIRKYSGFFRFFPGRDGTPLPEAEGFTWYDWGNPLEGVGIQLDSDGVLVLIDGDRHFVLGRCPCAMADHGYTPPIEAEPGDTTSITLDRGMASWPTPLHIGTCRGPRPMVRDSICLPVSSRTMRARAAGTNPAPRIRCASTSGRRVGMGVFEPGWPPSTLVQPILIALVEVGFGAT
jgi:hypothetical protein